MNETMVVQGVVLEPKELKVPLSLFPFSSKSGGRGRLGGAMSSRCGFASLSGEVTVFRQNPLPAPSMSSDNSNMDMEGDSDITTPAMVSFSDQMKCFVGEDAAAQRALDEAGHAAFQRIQKSGDASLSRSELADASREMRRALDEATARLDSNVDGSEESFARSEYLKVASAVWHLLECMVLSEDNMRAEMLEWIWKHYPRMSTDEDDGRRADVTRKGSASREFWPLVHSLVLEGQTEEAARYIRLDAFFASAVASSATAELLPDEGDLLRCFIDVVEALESMPSLGARTNADEFKSEWLLWHQKIERLRSVHEAMFASKTSKSLEKASAVHGLQIVLGLLCGDGASVEVTLTGEYDTWTHIMSAKLLYENPMCKKGDLAAVAEECVALMETPSSAPLDLQLGALRGETMAVLQKLHLFVNDYWVSCHLCEVLSRAGAVESVAFSNFRECDGVEPPSTDSFLIPGMELDFREWFIAAFASRLGLGLGCGERTQAQWRLSVDYFASLQRMVPLSPFREGAQNQLVPLGRFYVEHITSLQCPETDEEAETLALACEGMNLQRQAHSIRTSRMMHWWGQWRGEGEERQRAGFSQALRWARRCGPDAVSRMLASTFASSDLGMLNAFVDTAENIRIDDSTVSSAEMAFLARYKEMRTAMQGAAKLLERFDASPGVDSIEVLERAVGVRDEVLRALCEIFDEGIVPEGFTVPLIHHLLTWLGTDSAAAADNPPSLTVPQTMGLMDRVEGAHGGFTRAQRLQKQGDEEGHIDKLVVTTRSILSATLARSVLAPQVAAGQ